jgi:transcriptional regulator with XRE-family HTH domain
LNETFCRALLRAGLTEDDLAARLGVDPKTVRRWIEGRALPYRRHRWALAALLATAETDLWPELRSFPSRPVEVVAVYPHLGTVPCGVWQSLYGSAQGVINIIDSSRPFLACDREVLTALADRARAGVAVRICLVRVNAVETATGSDIDMGSALERFAPLRGADHVQIRLHRGTPYSLIYRADGQLLVAQHAFGVSDAQVPVLHLQQSADGDMFATYIDSFDQAWATADPAN